MHYVKKLQLQVEHLEAKLEGRDRAFRSIIQSRFDKDGGGHRVAYRQAIEEVDRMMDAYKNIEADSGEFKATCTQCGMPIVEDDWRPEARTIEVGGRWSGTFCDDTCVTMFGFTVVNGEYVLSQQRQ